VPFLRDAHAGKETMMRQDKDRKRRRDGFTLVELLLVITILGILATIVLVRFAGHGERARIRATQTSIQNISVAIDAYEVEMTQFPSDLSQLTQATEERGAFLKDVPKDAWGTAFQYKKKGKFEYELRSAGPDTQMGTDDDITN
jgi:general secretion pathway protein G